MTDTKRDEGSAEKAVAAWNAKHGVGTVVAYWSLPTDEARIAKTRTEAQLLSGHTAVVWLEGVSGCWALSHVRAVLDAEG